MHFRHWTVTWIEKQGHGHQVTAMPWTAKAIWEMLKKESNILCRTMRNDTGQEIDRWVKQESEG